eukprot:Tbor_TRINITY_DN4988_c0_g2::TRINITY_DN4988_c0_g2_i3::g.9655::m.9655
MRRYGLGSSTVILLKRFIPPWEREGKTFDELYDGILKSRNPGERAMRDRYRYDSNVAADEEKAAMEEAEQQRELSNYNQLQNRIREADTYEKKFLPFGATPKYFNREGMAVWGSYEQQINIQYTDEQTRGLLVGDMDTKLPYKYESIQGLSEEVLRNTWPLGGSHGFVLDIDGVVYRSKEVIDGSDSAIKMMQKLRIPFVFMTNGGGCTELDKAAQLTDILKLDIPITEDQVVMSHTPMRFLTAKYANEPILVAGKGCTKQVALSYGFKKVTTIEEVQQAMPELVPFRTPPITSPGDVHLGPFNAILILNDLDDAFNDIQVIIDVLTSPMGCIGSSNVSRTQSIPVYWMADDLFWATKAKMPRLGGGAFREMLFSAYESVTGEELEVTCYGKPRAISYAYCEHQLTIQTKKLGWSPSDLRTISMVGDNLDTDIIGANAFGGKWFSVHVMSGVGSVPAAKRTVTSNDDELHWILDFPNRSPHYISPTLDHFLREAMAFGEETVLLNRTKYYGKPNPVDLEEQYMFRSGSSS